MQGVLSGTGGPLSASRVRIGAGPLRHCPETRQSRKVGLAGRLWPFRLPDYFLNDPQALAASATYRFTLVALIPKCSAVWRMLAPRSLRQEAT